ncbi:MAG: hypothetical protein GX112_13270 [Clostridiaceae bacterium]|jgi:hypothetical protein|nr:hypothetical protein [Clostridiaceae bacterium]
MSELSHSAPAPAGRLAESLEAVRRQLPLPEELLRPADTEDRDRLAVIIETSARGEAIIDLARQLTSRDLRHIFPLLSEPVPADARFEHYHEKLYLIIRERACPSLYRYGWSVFQQVYPSAPVARGLAILCSILDIKQHSQKTSVRSRRGQNQPPLISNLVAPDARQFEDRLLKVLVQRNVPLEQFMTSFAVRSDMPFGASLLARCFIAGDARLYAGGHLQFRQALAKASPDRQAALIHRLFQLKDLPPETTNRYYQEIYRQFGDPERGHPIWSQVKSRDLRRFRDWITAATIGSHCRKNKAKARFYLHYARFVESIEQWDDDTLLLRFPGFLIADDRRQPLFAVYYELSDPEILPFDFQQSQDDLNPANPQVPHRRVEDAVSRSSTQGPVGLLFDETGLATSAMFMDFCLSKKRIASRSQLKNISRSG